MVLIYLSIAWMAGIYLASRLSLPLFLWCSGAALPLCIAWLWRRQARLRRVALMALFSLLGAIRYTVAIPRFNERSVSTYNDRGWTTLVGVVSAEPDVRDSYINLRLRTETVSLADEEPVHVKGSVLVRAPRYPEPRYGDRLLARGMLQTPPVFEGFSYGDYLARQGVYSVMNWARITTLAREQGNPLLTLLFSFKHHTQEVIANILPEPCASLLSGILLGVESGIPDELAADFRATGTSHIIAISGFNMAILSGIVSSLCVRLFGRRYAAWFSTAAIALYTLFVGAAAAVVRAAVMGCVALWGQHFGRQNASPNALFATALLMTAWNPYTLWDLGFSLSFAATLGLVVFAEPFQRAFERLLTRLVPSTWTEPLSRFFQESLVLTTCAQLTTMPIILYSFRTFSPVTLLSNVLILPPQTQVMLWGAMATAGGLIWLPLGRVTGWVAWIFLAYTIWMVETTARVQRAVIDLGWVSPALIWAWYGLLIAVAWLQAQTSERRKKVWQSLGGWLANRLSAKLLVAGLAVAALLLWLAVAALPDGKLHVTLLDIGRGEAAFIETPSGQHILIDGGPSPTKIVTHLGRRLPFWDRSLDLVVLTDPSEEHLTGLIPALERYEVSHVLQSPQSCTVPACIRWQELLREKGITARQPIAGTTIDAGQGLLLTVLYPAGDGPDPAEAPLILRLDYGQTCVLFAASGTRRVESAILARREDIGCDVLQVAHQGDESTTTFPFLQGVNPALAVISCAQASSASHPDEATILRLSRQGATVLRTDEVGSVEVISDGTSYEVKVGR